MNRCGGRRERVLGAALAALVGLGGCPRAAPVLDFGPGGRLTDPNVAFDAVVARRAKIRSVNGEAKVSVDSPQGGGKVTELVAAEAPARLRLDSVSTFGPLASLTSDGTTFRLADVEHKRFYEGPATAENVSRLLPVRVPAEELVSLLLGVPPLLPAAQPLRLEVDPVRAVYVLTVTHGSDLETLLLDPLTLRTVGVVVDDRPSLGGYRAGFEGFGGELDLPKVVKVSTLDGSSKVELKWREREVNAPVDPATFTLAVPDGFERAP